jgi:AcrR family transcriptional regulator
MRTNPTQQRSRETVSAALAAANEEFAEHGFHGAQMVRIARRAEVSVGALYRFFPDKQSLARALADEYREQVEQRYGEVLADVAGPEQLVPAVRRIIRVAGELQREHPGYYRLTSDVNPSQDESWGHEVRAGLIKQFTTGLEAIGVDAPDAERIIEFAIEVARATLATLPVDGPGRNDVLEELEEMIATYLATRLELPNPEAQ